jgi:VWFA-related protein
MLNTTTLRRALLTIAAAFLMAAQPGASGPAPQMKPTGGGQPPTPQALPQPAEPARAARPATPVVRITTRLVQVSVVAHDGHGNPVADLTQEDFRLFDNGQEQKISFFSKDSSEVRAGTTPALPPDTWSNVSNEKGGTPVNLTVILFDQVNTAQVDQANARNQIVHFLKQMRPEDRIALYALGDGLRILHDFTSDPDSLLRALAKAQARSGRLVPDNDPGTGPLGDTTGDPDLDAFLAAADTSFVQYQVTDRILRTTDALEAIAAHVGSLPGRKNLLWVSSAFPLMIGYDMDPAMVQQTGLDVRSFLVEVDRAGRALNDANVAVYPVDAHRLSVSLTAITTPYVAPSNTRVPATRAPSITPNRAGVETMENIAARTGGVAYHDTNDLSAALRSAMDDSRVVYTLAYMPSHNEWDNKFRKIKVEARRSGVHLRYRSGYFAIPDAHLDPTQRTQMLAEAQWSVFDATQIPLKLEIVRVMNNDIPSIKFAILADSSGLRFTETEGRHDTDMLLTLGEKGPDGKLVHEETKTLTFRLKDESYKEVMAKGMRLTATMPLDPTAVSFRIVLLDAADGHLGSLEVPIGKLRTVAGPGAPAAPPPAPTKPGED